LRIKVFCKVCNKPVDVKTVYINAIGITEILLSCGHKRFFQLEMWGSEG